MVEAVNNQAHDAELVAAESRKNLDSQGRQASTGQSMKRSMAKASTDKISANDKNIVIDIESEDLTYNQARSIRLRIQKDVE